MSTPQPPAYLSERSREFWTRIQQEFAIVDECGLALLRGACESLDTAELARLEIVKNGPFVVDRLGNHRPSPGIAAQRNALLTFSRLCKSLGIDLLPGSKP